jgi:hypothetical protein
MVMSDFFTVTLFSYGAPELKESYKKNLSSGLIIAVMLHFIIVGMYWAIVYLAPEEEPRRVVRITPYRELDLEKVRLASLPPKPTIFYEGNQSGESAGASPGSPSGPERETTESATAPRAAPQRMNLAAELGDLDIGTPILAQPKFTGRGGEGKNSPAGSAPPKRTPVVGRDDMTSLLESGFDADLDGGINDLGARLPGQGRGQNHGIGKDSGIRIGNSGEGNGGTGPGGLGGGGFGQNGLGNGAGVGDGGLGLPGRGDSGRGKAGQASVKVDLKGLDDFGENYRNFTPIYRGLIQWIRRYPADLGEVGGRFMGYQSDNLSSRAIFKIGGREFEMLLLCVESTFEVRVCLIEGSEVTYLIDQGFKKQSNYLRIGAVTQQADGEILRFGSALREASDRRTQEFYQIFLSWWDTVKDEAGGK